MAELDEITERGELILAILDKIKPIPKNAPGNVQDEIDTDRQILVLRAGWNTMPLEELRKIAAGNGS